MQRLRADDETPQAALRRLAGSNGHSVPLSGSAKEASKKKNQRTKPSKSSQQQLNSTQPLQQGQQQQHRDTEQLDQPMDGLDGADSDNKGELHDTAAAASHPIAIASLSVSFVSLSTGHDWLPHSPPRAGAHGAAPSFRRVCVVCLL